MKKQRKERNYKERKETASERFFLDFAAEIDLFDSTLNVPEWVFDYRDDLLRKLKPEFRRICRRLKELGLEFKIKWPVEIFGRWKFADIIFPKQRTVLVVTNEMETASKPHWMRSDRAEFFADRFRVVEIETVADLERKMAIKANNEQ